MKYRIYVKLSENNNITVIYTMEDTIQSRSVRKAGQLSKKKAIAPIAPGVVGAPEPTRRLAQMRKRGGKPSTEIKIGDPNLHKVVMGGKTYYEYVEKTVNPDDLLEVVVEGRKLYRRRGDLTKAEMEVVEGEEMNPTDNASTPLIKGKGKAGEVITGNVSKSIKQKAIKVKEDIPVVVAPPSLVINPLTDDSEYVKPKRAMKQESLVTVEVKPKRKQLKEESMEGEEVKPVFKGHYEKGSPEAKARMAELRGMQTKKKQI